MRLLNHKLKWPSMVVFYASLATGIIAISTENQFDEIWKVPVYQIIGDESGFLGMGKRGWTETAIFNELLTVIIIVSGIIASFSREKIEDELITKIRLESLSTAIVINYILVLIANFLIFDLSFLTALIVFLFAPLVMFNLIFQVRLFNYYKINDEK